MGDLDRGCCASTMDGPHVAGCPSADRKGEPRMTDPTLEDLERLARAAMARNDISTDAEQAFDGLVSALLQQVRELREALKPFADYALAIEPFVPDSFISRDAGAVKITVGDFRRALSTLSKTTGGGER